MKRTIFLFFLLSFLIPTIAQNNETEIYVVHSDSIIKGKIVENSVDSIKLMLDSATCVSFAKNELQGRDLPVSKEIKKLKVKLIRNERMKEYSYFKFPGVNSIKHGNKIRGYIIAGLATVSILGILVVTPVFIGIASAQGLYGLFILLESSAIFGSSGALYGIALMWNNTEIYLARNKRVNNRYYYMGTKF